MKIPGFILTFLLAQLAIFAQDNGTKSGTFKIEKVADKTSGEDVLIPLDTLSDDYKGILPKLYSTTYLDDKVVLKCPAEAKALGVSGTVNIGYQLNEDGSATNVMVTKGVHTALDEAAVRYVQSRHVESMKAKPQDNFLKKTGYHVVAIKFSKN